MLEDKQLVMAGRLEHVQCRLPARNENMNYYKVVVLNSFSLKFIGYLVVKFDDIVRGALTSHVTIHK